MDNICDAIGNTPLVRLRRASELTGCHIYGKAEWMNPGASVKDRAALGMVRDAEARGLLEPGGTIVEGTAGNTGIGLAVVANVLGYRVRIIMPNTQSVEKVHTLQAYGAEVKLIPAVPFKNPNHFVHVSKREAEELAKSDPRGAYWANQFDNTANREMHAATTGPEIFEQTDGRIDGFICAAGTGGTLSGVAEALRARKPQVRIGLADPTGSGLYNHYRHGELKVEGSSISEGIGNSRITANLDGVDVDVAYRISDEESVPLVFDLMREEGLLLGSSSGVNVAGAIRLAQALGPGKTIVTILCDTGLRYMKRLYNPDWLREKGFAVPDWLLREAESVTP